ncbi:MAG: ATP-binding protein [Haloferacaceae archaeon]
MNDDYLQAFIRESEEQLTDLNNSLLALESEPDDREAMGNIFRTAHTLKGNFGAMGFDTISDLAHAIEDLLDEIRSGNVEVTPEIMDLVFAGVDQIEVALDEIEAEGEASVDPSDLEDEIRQVIEEEAGGETADGDGADGDPTNGAADAGEGVYRARVDVGDPEMKGVDGMLVLDAVREEFDLVDADPSADAIEDGEYEASFDLYVSAESDEAVSATLADVTAVESAAVAVADDGDAAATPDEREASPAAADESESARTAEATDDDSTDHSTDDHSTADDSADGSESSSTTSPSSASSTKEISSVRVDVDQLDDLHGLVEQLVTSRIKLRRAVEEGDIATATDNLSELDKITANLQNTVMDVRLIPMKKVISKFPRLVRDLAREQDKEIDFSMEGQDIELDRTILTEISDPLMHILRNAVDHGIEPPAERAESGKPREGTIELRATRERDHVTVEVEDDGRGLDVERLREEALERGVRSAAELDAMEDSEVYDLVFHPGFSTADEVTDVSGRGVGMDVVHSTVKQLDGSVSVESELGEGTTVSLRLPVTVAIVKVLFVEVGDEEFGVPIKNVDEVSREGRFETISERAVIEHDDDIYQVIDLAEVLDVPGDTEEDGMLLRIRKSERAVALRCDSVNKQEEVVVKPLEGILSGIPGLSGTAVLGDGNIVPILDVVTL